MSEAVKNLIDELVGLMPGPYQKQNFEAALELFLEVGRAVGRLTLPNCVVL
jgi:hypothetical protein